MDNREKQAAFRARQRERGLEAVTEWIPAEQRGRFRDLARQARDGAHLPSPEPTPVTNNVNLAIAAATLVNTGSNADGRRAPDDVLLAAIGVAYRQRSAALTRWLCDELVGRLG